MTKRQLMVKLRRLSKGWRDNTFVYQATDEAEQYQLYRLCAERKIGLGGFGWVSSPFYNTVTIR